MSDINSVEMSGRLTRDAELRQAVNGTQVASFGLAVEDYRKGATDSTGKVTNSYTNFVDCTMFGDRAEKMAKYLTKGQQLFVRGRLHWASWEKDGQKRSRLDVTVEDLVFGAAPKNAQQQAAQAAPAIASQPAAQLATAEVYDEEIPF